MLQQFKKDWKLHWKSFLGIQSSLIGFFLIGLVMVLVIMHADDDPGNWFCMGTLLAGIALCFVSVFTYGFSYHQEFQLALSMGRGRMAFLGAYTLRLILHFLVGFAIILGLYQVELALYARIFPQYSNDVAFTFLTNWRILLPLFLGLALLSLFVGAMYGRYGKKGLIFFYVLWVFCCLILPRMVDAESGSTGALDQAAFWTLHAILAVPVSIWIGFGAIVAVCMTTVIIRFAQTQMVK